MDQPAQPARPPRQHYIPLRKSDLVAMLAAEPGLTATERERLQQFCRLADAVLQAEAQAQLNALKDAYAPFDPDADTRHVPELAPRSPGEQAADVFHRFGLLLERANFRRLTREEIHSALLAASEIGVRLRVDLRAFRRLEVYVRGEGIDQRARRRWLRLGRAEIASIPTYRRLAVIFQQRSRADRAGEANEIFLKLFKNIPKADIEMLLPGTSVRMSWLDQGKIWFPTVSGLALALVKLFKGAALLAALSVYGLLAFLGLVGGTIGYGVRAFFSYLNTKDKYHLHLTRSLYFQNLDNNAGVLTRLMDEAQEQEFREVALAWFLLWRQGGELGWSLDQLDGAAERWLSAWMEEAVDFEADDALHKLLRLGLVERVEHRRWRALPAAQALSRLEAAWRQLVAPAGLAPPASPASAPHRPSSAFSAGRRELE